MQKGLGFTQKIIAISVSTMILALIIFSVISHNQMSNEIKKSLEAKVTQTAQITTSNLATWLQTRLNLTKSIADRTAKVADEEELVRVISAVNQGAQFKNVFYGTEDGRFIIDDTNTDDLSGFDPRGRPWYQLAKQKSSPTFSEPYTDAFTKELLITSVAPVNHNGFQGVIGSDIGLKAVSDTVNTIDFQGIGFAYLIDSEGKVLASPVSDAINKNISSLYTGKVNIDPTLQYIPDSNGVNRIVGYYPIKGIESVQWFVAIDIDEDKAYTALSNFRNSAIITTLIVVIISSLILAATLKLLTKPLLSLRDALFNIAEGEGDLTRRLEVTSHDELGEVATAFNTFVENIHVLIEDFKGSSENLATMVTSITEVTERSRNECQRQHQETDMVAAAVSQMSAAAQEIATHAQNAADAAKQADDEGSRAGIVVQEAISAIQKLAGEIDSATIVINDLESDVSNISAMVDVIRGIAEQTNLLALNAAIEAARAGEQGRGFAVVADEVRTLASKTQESTEEINSLIDRLQSASNEAVKAMATSKETGELTVSKANQAGESLQSIAHSVSTISDMNVQIATASEEQTAVTEDIARNITTIADSTASVTAAATETDESSQRLSEIGLSIKEKVDRFRT